MNEAGKVHGPLWAKWLGHLAGKPDVVGLEIGTFKGESAEWMCLNIFSHPNSRYYCVDPFTGSVEHKIGNIDCSTLEMEARARLAPFPQIEFRKGYSKDVLPEIHRKLDMAYCDGGHDSVNVLRDSVLLFDLLKVGGILVWDDYDWTVMADELDRPKIAIDSFLKIYSRQLKVAHSAWQVIAIKTSK